MAELVQRWIIDGFKPYNFAKINIELSGSTDVGDGYLGGFCFAKVHGETNDGRKEEFNVALKYGKNSPELREKLSISNSFQNEICVYATLVPIWKDMEKTNNFSEIDGFIVKCFNTLLYDNQEVLLLDDLKFLGYELHDRLKPFNIHHLKLTFDKYGKFHAFGLAYREKCPEEFSKLRLTLKARMKKSFPFFKEIIDISQDIAYSVLEANGELNLLDLLKKEMPEGFTSKFIEFCQIDEPNSVIIHSDAWNNNFMFKYEEPDKTKPSAVKFLDFQFIQVASPIYDLAYHVYVTASETELKEFPTLLRVYHDSLSTCLSQLGFSSDRLFPFSVLERQWKKYALYGVIMAILALFFALADETDAVDFTSNDESLLKKKFEQSQKKNFTLFVPRLLSSLRHYYGSMEVKA